MYISRKDKGKERPLRYHCEAIYGHNQRLIYRLRDVKTMAGVREFARNNRNMGSTYDNTKCKIEYTDLKTGITKEY